MSSTSDLLLDPSIPFVEEIAPQSSIDSFHAVKRDPSSWAGAMPASQGLYMNELEKDSCGVGFICHIKGEPSHKIVSDARQLLCAMTHRGATGADSRDGDGAGVMTSIPHAFFKREAERDIGFELPEPGEYAVGNVFFKANDPVLVQKHHSIFAGIAAGLGLRVLGWREVPTDGSILGPAASSTEPLILQPFVVLLSHYGDGNVSQRGHFDEKHFERQLYVLRKHATHSMFVVFYSCENVPSSIYRTALYKVRLRNPFMSAPCRPRTSSTKGSCRPLKSTITTMTLTMSFIVRISPWFIPDSRRTRSLAGIALNP